MIFLRLLIAAICFTAITTPCHALGLAGDAVNADFLWQQGYTGAGLEIGVIDLHQADSGHPALNSNFLVRLLHFLMLAITLRESPSKRCHASTIATERPTFRGGFYEPWGRFRVFKITHTTVFPVFSVETAPEKCKSRT